MIRIAAKYLYTLLPDVQDPIRDGFVELDDSWRVVRTGTCPDPAAEHTYLDGALVPGMVNSHCHSELSYMQGLFRRGTGMAGFIDQINELRDTVSLDEKQLQIEVAMATMYSSGIVAMTDISNCADSFQVKAGSQIYTRSMLEVFGTEPEDCPAVIESVKKLAREAEDCGLDASPTPHAVYTMSPELVTESSRLGLETGYLSYHCEETPQEEEMLRYGSGPMWDNRKAAGMSTPPVTGGTSLEYFIDRLEKIHPAPFTEHILLVHEVCMTAEGAALVKEKMPGAFVALCPRSNLYIHDMLPDVQMLRRSGLPLTLGTDSLSSNDSLDIVAEMYCLQEHFLGLELGEMLRWACLNGARFLGKDDILGSMAPGKAPGLVAIYGLDSEGRLTKDSTSSLVAPAARLTNVCL